MSHNVYMELRKSYLAVMEERLRAARYTAMALEEELSRVEADNIRLLAENALLRQVYVAGTEAGHRAARQMTGPDLIDPNWP